MPKVSTASEEVTARGTDQGTHYHRVTEGAGKNQGLCKALPAVPLTLQAPRGLLAIGSKNQLVSK